MKRIVGLLDSTTNNINQVFKKKDPSQSVLSNQLKELEEMYNALVNENNKNIKVICSLELKVKRLEENISVKIDSVSVLLQTDEVIYCHKCDYEAEDIYELDEHIYSTLTPGAYFICCYCQNSFNPEGLLKRVKI